MKKNEHYFPTMEFVKDKGDQVDKSEDGVLVNGWIRRGFGEGVAEGVGGVVGAGEVAGEGVGGAEGDGEM